jgi:hypothetical protein
VLPIITLKLPDALLLKTFSMHLLYQKFYRNERADLVSPKFFNEAGLFLAKLGIFLAGAAIFL